MKYLYCFLMILFFFSCQDQANKKSENEDILIVNINDLKFQTVDWGQMFDLSSLEVIPLETTPQSIFNTALRFLVCDSMYCVMTSLAVLTFDSEGHFVKKLSKKGRGPGEYLVLKDIWVDEKQGLYLLDCHGKKILNYNKRDSLKMSVPTDLLGDAFIPLTDDIWAIYTDSNVDINHDLYASEIRKNQDHSYYLYGVEVSVREPQNNCLTSSLSQNVIAYENSMWS